MHILIGLITALAGLFWAFRALQNSGFDINSLNPFNWYRRHEWAKKTSEKPLYALTQPMDIAAVYILGVARLEGELSRESKQAILRIFKDEFKRSETQAQDLLASSSYLLRDDLDDLINARKILEKSKGNFNKEQVDSTLDLVIKMSELESPTNEKQRAVIDKLTLSFKQIEEKSKW
ncbi:MAG: hypothetical protein ACI93R_003490 [Flavobacteriales bacterium]|jgi:hypothetical protein